MEYTVDATNKSLGRVATEVAVLLMGKNIPGFVRNEVANTKVLVENASKLKIDPRKLITKTYDSFSGYPGGLKQSSMQHVISQKGCKEVIEVAVKGMLPQNRLKKEFLKHLTITE